MFQWIVRQPLTLLGAIGLVSLLRSVVTFQEDILFLISTYQSITQPIWDFLFGWLFKWLQMPFPSWLKDYLSIGVITSAGLARTKLVAKQIDWESGGKRILWQIVATSIAIPFWPIIIVAFGFGAWGAKSKIEQLKRQSEHLKKLQRTDKAAYSTLAKDQLGDPIFWKQYEVYSQTKTLTTAALFLEVFIWAAVILAVNGALVN